MNPMTKNEQNAQQGNAFNGEDVKDFPKSTLGGLEEQEQIEGMDLSKQIEDPRALTAGIVPDEPSSEEKNSNFLNLVTMKNKGEQPMETPDNELIEEKNDVEKTPGVTRQENIDLMKERVGQFVPCSSKEIDEAVDNVIAAQQKLDKKTGTPREAAARKKLESARKKLEKLLRATSILTPVEFWTIDGNSVQKERKNILVAANPFIESNTRQWKQNEDIFSCEHFETESTKFVTPATLFSGSDIQLVDLNGNPINSTENCHVSIHSIKEQAYLQYIYNRNISLLVEGKELITVVNLQPREFTSLQECAKANGANMITDRKLSGKEKLNLASFASTDELIKKINTVAKEKGLPVSTATRYYTAGKLIKPKTLDKITIGLVSNLPRYDLTLGDKIISTLESLALGKEIKNRYLIDSICSFSRVMKMEIEDVIDLVKDFAPDNVSLLKQVPGKDKSTFITTMLQDVLNSREVSSRDEREVIA